MHFGALMLRAGNAAFRVRQWMNELARAMGIDALAVHIAIGGGMTATARRGGEHVTLASEIAPLGINASRLGLLERLAREARPGLTTAELAAKLKAIEARAAVLLARRHRRGGRCRLGCVLVPQQRRAVRNRLPPSSAAPSARVCDRCCSDTDITNTPSPRCAPRSRPEFMFWSRMRWRGAGLPVSPHAAGFISSALFLVPGFPLIAGLLDLVQHQIVAGITRLTYALMVLTAAAFGLCLVAAAASLSIVTAAAAAVRRAVAAGVARACKLRRRVRVCDPLQQHPPHGAHRRLSGACGQRASPRPA